MFQPLYTATATAHGGREGEVRSDDGVVQHKLSMPTSVGGKGGPGTNPEQLFAAGWSACFESALRYVALQQKKPVKDAHITAVITLGKGDDGGFQLAAELHGQVEGMSREEAQALMEAAHRVCPYSKATRGNVPVKLVAD
jgi:osmotically inducible protein OsmC